MPVGRVNLNINYSIQIWVRLQIKPRPFDKGRDKKLYQKGRDKLSPSI